MAAARQESMSGLQDAVRRETQEAHRLAGSLRGARGAMERLELSALQDGILECRRLAEGLSHAERARQTLTVFAARAAELCEGATLTQVAQKVDPSGQGLFAAARELAASLEELARESAALGIAARYSAGVWGHLSGLFGAGRAPYGPRGRLNPGVISAGCRA